MKHTDSSRKPAAPFITSSMVQDAANRLGFQVATTTSTAQALFEGGEQGGVFFVNQKCTVMIAQAVAMTY